MRLPCSQDRSTAHIKHLHRARVITGNEHPTISSNLSTARNIWEARNGLLKLASPGREDLHARTGRYGEGIEGWGVGDVCDGIGGGRRDKKLVLEGLPVALFGGDRRWAGGQLQPLKGGDIRRHGMRFSAVRRRLKALSLGIGKVGGVEDANGRGLEFFCS
jgi:hypothetical protein